MTQRIEGLAAADASGSSPRPPSARRYTGRRAYLGHSFQQLASSQRTLIEWTWDALAQGFIVEADLEAFVDTATLRHPSFGSAAFRKWLAVERHRVMDA